MDTVKEAAKNVQKAVSNSGSQFEQGHEVPIHHHDQPGFQHKMAGQQPVNTHLPTEDGGYQKYKAAGKLEGKKALITGGDSGIGRAIAILFAMEGADVYISYLPQEEKDAQETKRRVTEAGGKCYAQATDLTKGAQASKDVVENAVAALGGLNIVVNNAAFQNTVTDIKDLEEEQWLHTFNVNIHPTFYISKYALPHLKSGDTIINNASINAYVGRPDLLDYTSTKGAIVAFTRALSNQQLSKGLRVNAVCPGPVWTPLIPATMHDEAQDSFTSPMGRPLQPSEMATCFVFLASQDSSALSGQCLHANGGVIVNG